VIQSKDYAGRTCTLVSTKTGKPVMQGDLAPLSGAHNCIVSGGRAPHKPSSSGKVWVQDRHNSSESEFYPSVIDAQWVPDFEDTQFAPLT
jgi:hypothetical protein